MIRQRTTALISKKYASHFNDILAFPSFSFSFGGMANGRSRFFLMKRGGPFLGRVGRWAVRGMDGDRPSPRVEPNKHPWV